MMSTRPQSEELAIEHVRKPRERMPVSGFAVQLPKRPLDPLPRESRLDHGIQCHVNVIVVVNEFVPVHAPEYRDGRNCQRRDDCPFLSAFLQSGYTVRMLSLQQPHSTHVIIVV